MKRDWKIIRKILLEEDVSHLGEKPVIAEHFCLCHEAGYINGVQVLTNGVSGYETILRDHRPLLTAEGRDVADLLRNESFLDDALATLTENGIGHCSFFLFDILRKKMRNKLIVLDAI